MELDVDPEDLAGVPIEDEVVGFSACSPIVFQIELRVANVVSTSEHPPSVAPP